MTWLDEYMANKQGVSLVFAKGILIGPIDRAIIFEACWN